MKKNYLIALVLVLITMLSTTVFAANFSDLQKGHWAYEPIMEMANKGILNGYPDGTFLPDKSITRAEFAKILVLALDLETNGKTIEFQDVSRNDWSYKYVQAAAKYLSAYRDDRNNLMYMPDAKAVREDVAVAIVIASGHENDKYSLKTLNKFSDKDQISSNLRKYVAIAVENGLMSGHSNGTFEPRGYLTRAQVSKLMKNIEEVKDKVVVKETDDSDITTEDYFDDISFNSKTLELDLGENWDRYQFCPVKHEKTIYVPSQRYLKYQVTTSISRGKDKETGNTLSPIYSYFGGKEKETFKIMLKGDKKTYITIQLTDPFYASKLANKVYTDSNTGERYVEEVVVATNKLVKAEYKIDNESWIDATNSITNKKADVIVNVEKYDDEAKHEINIRLTDEYGNVCIKEEEFSMKKEYFTDIKFNSETLELDLGENWDKYLYGKGWSIYAPSQRYLTYEDKETCPTKIDKETGNKIACTYWYYIGYYGTPKNVEFKIMLKSNPEVFIIKPFKNPFWVIKEPNIVYTNPDTNEKYVEEIVTATNRLVKAEYSIDNEKWIEDATAINNNRANLIVNVEKYKDGQEHRIHTRLTDEYGNRSIAFVHTFKCE